MDRPLSVSEYNALVTKTVDSNPALRDVMVTGELKGVKYTQKGHVYFDLKDSECTLSCALFRGNASRVKFELKDGKKVTVFGKGSYYGAYGKFSFHVESMVEYGKGELQAALEALTKKLFEEGLFEPERKRPIPKYPKTIGVATSATGAVIKDIIDTTALRYPVNILLAPTIVQGEEACDSIVKSIELLNKCDVDVIIVGRGGGSADDLSAFNLEPVVRAVANSRIPIISAVGHATDKSLTDKVADLYAVTPTAAAEHATPDSKDLLEKIDHLSKRSKICISLVSSKVTSKFNILDQKLSPKIFMKTVEVYRSKFEGMSRRMVRCVENVETHYVQKIENFDMLDEKMSSSMSDFIRNKKHAVELFSKSLEGLNPKSVLGRGYSFVTDSEGNIVSSVDGIKTDSDITVTMKDGNVLAKVKEVKKNDRI